jgi:hypothetical protein
MFVADPNTNLVPMARICPLLGANPRYAEARDKKILQPFPILLDPCSLRNQRSIGRRFQDLQAMEKIYLHTSCNVLNGRECGADDQWAKVIWKDFKIDPSFDSRS